MHRCDECDQSPSKAIDVFAGKPKLLFNGLHFMLTLHSALLPFHYIHAVLAASAEAEKRIQEQLCRLSYCTSGECASLNRRFSNGTENTIPWVLEQVDQNGMMGPPMGRVHPSIVGCPLGSFIGQIGHVPKIYPLYRVNFNRASWPP